MNQLDAEIFAVGRWNGMTFTADDLSAIVAAFTTLRSNHRVPLKFGHNDEQPMTDGFPALGWVDKLWVAGDKLMAKFVDMPDVVFKAIQKKLYKSVSIELDMDVKYKATEYPFVLSGVALLGADIPAVNTLKDLTHFLSRDTAFSVGRRAAFSAIAGITNPKEKHMEKLDELTQKVAELTTSVATFSTNNATLKAENAELAAKVAKFEADAAAKADSDAKAAITAKRTEVTTLLENGVKSEAITPAQREQFTKLMRVDDDIAVMALDIEEVKKLTANGKKQFSREQGRTGVEGETLTAPEQVVTECYALIAEGKAKDFTTAQAIVFARNPKLARAYVDFNEEE